MRDKELGNCLTCKAEGNSRVKMFVCFEDCRGSYNNTTVCPTHESPDQEDISRKACTRGDYDDHRSATCAATRSRPRGSLGTQHPMCCDWQLLRVFICLVVASFVTDVDRLSSVGSVFLDICSIFVLLYHMSLSKERSQAPASLNRSINPSTLSSGASTSLLSK